MSSDSSSLISSIESQFISSTGGQVSVSLKPNTTEISQSRLSTQDDLLKPPEKPSKPVPSLTISSFDSAANQENGILRSYKERCDSESSTNSVNPKRLKKNDAVSVDNETREICRFFQKTGFCRYGRSCKFDHFVSVRPKSRRGPYVKSLNENSNDENITSTELDLNADNTVSKQDDDQSTKSNQICRNFFRIGHCRFGSSCKYVHSVPQALEQLSIDKERNPNGTTLKTDEDETDFKFNSEIEPTVVQNEAKPKTTSKNKSSNVCRNFSRTGYCRFGNYCRYDHSEYQAVEDIKVPKNIPLKEITDRTDFKRNTAIKSADDNAQRKPKTKVCKYFSRFGNCQFEVCKFVHERASNQNETKTDFTENQSTCTNEIVPDVTKETKSNCELGEDLNEDDGKGRFICKRPVLLRNKNASEMTAEDLLKLRDAEISQLKRRFPKLVAVPDSTGCSCFEIEFFPTDPDWRFDVKSVNLLVIIQENYPKSMLQLETLNPKEILPEKLIRYLNKTMAAWIQVQHEKNLIDDKIQLVFRPFIRWLDQSLEDIFISGLKMVKREIEAQAAGIEFVPHETLSQNIQANNENCSNPMEIKEEQPEEEAPDTPEVEESMPAFLENSNPSAMLVDQTIDQRALQDTAKRGTEIKLRNLELTEGAAGLTCRQLTVTVQCGRCKMRSDVEAVPHRNHRVVCERCHHEQRLSFRPQMLHQYSSILGYLDLEKCQVIDVPLLTCEFALQCLPCGRQNLLTSLQYGQHHSSWCLFCNSKMVVFVESIKLNQLQPSNIAVESLGQLLKLEKKEKRVKDPAIQEGKPLPENGICKHYKKSFRWLRFPCCGKAYPCDFCHDEKETDHDMKYATRMICGFCAKEQPYANDRPCVLCDSNMTKKSGAHWEGGKGCRDKVKMSKDDKQKYSGVSKTVSRKAAPAPKKK